MIIFVALAVGLAMGVDARRVLLLAGAVYLPLVVGALIGLHWYRSRSGETTKPALFCLGAASELRAGASLRDALTAAATSVGIDPAAIGAISGASLAEVAALVSGEFPSIGEEIRLTVKAAARSGSDSAALFDEIGSLAIAQSEIRREVAVATAPGRATAILLVGAPIVYVTGRAGSGNLSELLASPEQRVVTLLGLALFLGGVVVTGLILWRSAK
ncbi:MAG TPA: hypothetical protein VMM14_00485 [Acidimicrobiia bacterium]|nr:hypothetical protein [Acidimicrobiia bacterium]